MGHKQTEPPTKEFHTVGYVAGVIGMCPRTLYRAIKSGKIKALTFGSSLMIHQKEFERITQRGF